MDDDRFVWQSQPLSLTQGERGYVTVELRVPRGWEVFRPDVVVSVADAAGLDVGEPQVPAGRLVAHDGSAPVQAFHDDVTIRVPIDAGRSEAGLRKLVLLGEVRGCSARRCHAGTRETLSVYVHVRDRSSAPR